MLPNNVAPAVVKEIAKREIFFPEEDFDFPLALLNSDTATQDCVV